MGLSDMSNDRGTYGTAKTFGQGVLTGGVFFGIAALLLRQAVRRQRQHVAAINAYQPRYFDGE